MKASHLTDFRIFPAVVRGGVPTEITVSATGENGRFVDGETYGIELWAAEDATHHGYAGLDITRIEVVAAKGKLTFTATFAAEQRYAVKIRLPEHLQYSANPYYHPPYRRVPNIYKKPPLRNPILYLYAVEEDLYGLRVYKGDLHLHSVASDGHESLGGVMANLRKAGFDFAALTNHYVHLSQKELAATFEGMPDIFTCLQGEEVHVPEEFIHEVCVGGRESVNAHYRANKEQCEAEIDSLIQTLDIPEGVDPYNLGVRLWIADTAKKFGGMPIITHPYWIWSDVYFVPPKLHLAMYTSGRYEAFELLNGGCGPETNNLQTAFYHEMRERGITMPVVGSSDCHCTDRDDERRPTDAYTLVLAKGRSWEEIHEAILSYRSVAVEEYPTDTLPHIYGSYRLVKYMQFLVMNYYPVYAELCHAQGQLMKEYSYTKNASLLPLLEALYARSEAFAASFFGESGDPSTSRSL